MAGAPQPVRGPGGDAELASWAQRAVGRGIDLLITGLLFLAVTVPAADRGLDGDSVTIPSWAQLVVLLLWVAYEAGTVALLGTTMGKMAVGIGVVDARTGNRPSWQQAIIRGAVIPALAPLIGFFALPLYSTATFDVKTRRGLLDRLAGTAVVKLGVPASDAAGDPAPA